MFIVRIDEVPEFLALHTKFYSAKLHCKEYRILAEPSLRETVIGTCDEGTVRITNLDPDTKVTTA